MQGPDLTAISQWPPLLQLAAFVGVAIATMAAAVFQYLRKSKALDPVQRHEAAQNLVLSAGTIADMGPVRDAAAALVQLNKHAEDMLEEQRRTRHVFEEMVKQMAENAAFDRGIAMGRAGRRDGFP